MNKWPLGVFKYTPVEDEEDDSAEKREIDMSYFVESPQDSTYVCKLNGKKYTREQMLRFEQQEEGRVWVLSPGARNILRRGIQEMYPEM